jgi:hypothetical protein
MAAPSTEAALEGAPLLHKGKSQPEEEANGEL